LFATGIVLLAGQIGALPDHLPTVLIPPAAQGRALTSPEFRIIAALLAGYSVIGALLTQRFGLRRSLSAILGSLLALVAMWSLGVYFFALDLPLVQLVLAGALAVLMVQLARLWSVDRHLGRVLFSAQKQSNSNASSRLTSGLKVLNSVLPLNEAIVFHRLESGTLETLARYKGPGNRVAETGRNSRWRDGIRLCEQAIKTNEITVDETNSQTVALPLNHEHEIVGVLLVRLMADFSLDDRSLLEAVGSQFGRNLKRESFAHSTASNSALSFFSHSGAIKKLDALFVLKAQATEQRSEATAFSRIEDGIGIAYLDGTIALTNPALLTFAGITPEQSARLDLFGLLDYFRVGVFDEPALAVKRVLQTGIDYESELTFESRNQILGLRISLLREDGNGEPLGIAVYVKDLTRVKEYDKMKSDMISLMSHELRTPLTSINGFAELLTSDGTIPEGAREFVTIIANEAQRMSRMINTFLAVTQLERKDKQEVLKIPLRLDEVVRDTIATMQPMAKKKRIRLVEQPSHRIPPVAADRSLITQVVKNLLNNAIRYSPERTTVTVSTALEAEAVRVSVEDRGYGIPAEAKERVWEKFYRVVREGQEKDEESTGLGLSFVREVVEQHGGSVALDTEEGRGSKFSFCLPRL
jgi:signal transduction histidine kinase